jgi:hypothetical protein
MGDGPVDPANMFGPAVALSSIAAYTWRVAAGDCDGDGLVDVMYAAEGNNRVAWLRNLGDGVFGDEEYVVCSTCVGANEVVLLDVDDDGDLDAIVSSQVRGWAECVPV